MWRAHPAEARGAAERFRQPASHEKAPDIDRLADALNAWQSDGDGGPSRLAHWLTIVTERGASDLLLVAGLPPSIRVDGTIRSLPEGPLDGPEIEDAVLPVPRGTFTTSC